MLPAVIATGLALLPKLPAAWGAIAGLFGKKVPDSIQAAGKMAGDVMGAMKRGEIPPEKIMEVKAIFYEHEEEMKKLENEERARELQHIEMQERNMQEMWANEIQSDDTFVKRTRPKILRQLFASCVAYAFLATFLIGFLVYQKTDSATLQMAIGMIKYLGGTLFATFSAAFLGYTAARSVDKRNSKAKDAVGVGASLLKTFL